MGHVSVPLSSGSYSLPLDSSHIIELTKNLTQIPTKRVQSSISTYSTTRLKW